jgi:glycosyltransferase involved in cell wall biosynthesis
MGGAEDAVADGGVVVDPGDVDALVAAMAKLTDPETARRLGEYAYEHSALYTWKAVGERVLRALRPAGVELDRLADFLQPSTAAGRT